MTEHVKASIQKEFMPLVNMTMQGGKSVPLYITKEWRRPLEQMAQLINEQQLAIEALQARLTAGGL